MKTNFDKARDLITQLEEKLHATSTHTSTAREVLNKWIHSGEAQMRKKSAAALKQVRRKADGFTKALTKLEENLSKSLGKMTRTLETPATKPVAKAQPIHATRARPKQGGKATVNLVAAPLAKPKVVRKKSLNQAVQAQDIRTQAHAAGRGRRRQAKRDAK